MGELVSVIIPSFKSDESLIIAINSVLNQTYQDIEVIVVDDNNPYSDARKITEKNMNRYMLDERVKYVKHEKNKNGAAARNTGIRLAQGEYLTFLDDDDVFMPLRIQKCVDELSTDTNYSAVYSDVELYEAGKEIGIVVAQKEGGIWRELLKNEGLLGTGSNIFLKKDAVNEIGYFDETFIRYQDVEYMLRFLQKFKIKGIQEVLVRKNIGTRNIPQYKKYKENKLKLFSKFSDLIKDLTEDEKKLFFEYHYKILFRSAVEGGNKTEINEAAQDLKKIRELTLNEKISIYVPWTWKIYVKIYKAFKFRETDMKRKSQ